VCRPAVVARRAASKVTRRGEGAGSRRRLFLLRLSWSRSISPLLIAPRGCCHEDRPSGRWPAVCCCWALLLRTRNRIAHMAAQCCNRRLRRGHGSRGFRPCLVRMAVSGRARLASCPGGLLCAIRVNRMSKKYAGAKQTENCSNRFNHLTHPDFSYR
jgi:hypothetical protein